MKYSYFFLALNFCTIPFIKGNAEIINITYDIKEEYKLCKEAQNSDSITTDFGTIEKIKKDGYSILKTRVITNLDELQREPYYNSASETNIKERILNRVKVMEKHSNIGNKIDHYTKITKIGRASEYDHCVEIVCKTIIFE
jgi:hypothetical protein